MRTHVNPITNLRREELEACARVTKLHPTSAANDPAREGKQYEGMLAYDVRVGRPMVLMLSGNKRRLVTSTIRRINPISSAMMEVETSNSRYYVRRLLPESLVETDDSAA